MPEGYAKLGQDKINDLLAFLTSAEPLRVAEPQQASQQQPPPKEGRVRESGGNRPPPQRTRAEVNAVLGKSGKVDVQKLRPLRVLLVAGPKDHGPGEHDYPLWQKEWEPLLGKSAKVKVTTAFGAPEAKHWESADLAVFYCWGPQFWNAESYAQLDKFLARGGGVVLLHSATIAEKGPEQFADRVGICFRTLIKFRHGPVDLNVPPGALDHPVMRGFGTVHQVDESYWPHVGAGEMTMLATTPEEGSERPMAWAAERGKGRVFGTLLGHYTWTFDDPLARLLILRGMAWAAGEPAGRFEALATDGVELKD
jgi:type 1 glutamine amidotransferase